MIYVVNELCELDETYVDCHGAFTNKKDAYAKAKELFEQAKIDLSGNNCYDCEEDLAVWNSYYSIKIEVSSVNLNINEEDSKQLASSMIDYFECTLEENDITIPDKERTGHPSEARIFGETYYHLEDSIIEELDKI